MHDAPRLFVYISDDISYEFFHWQMDEWSREHGRPEMLITDEWDGENQTRERKFISEYAARKGIRMLVIEGRSSSSGDVNAQLDIHYAKIASAITHSLFFTNQGYGRLVELICLAGKSLMISGNPYRYDQYHLALSRPS